MIERLNNPNTIIIIGRANSGTRILPEAMKESGVYLGANLNIASDLLPTEPIYKACRIFGKHVKYYGKFVWDFSEVCNIDIPTKFIELLEEYLKPLINSESEKVGWKIPNNTLIYPWLVRLLPNATFIHWTRHPEGTCAKMTGVDRLEKWNIPCKKFLFHDWNYKIKVASWKYHYDIVKFTPKPKNFLQIRFEDYVTNQAETKKLVEEKIGVSLIDLDLNKSKAQYSKKNLKRKYSFLIKPMVDLKYD